MILIFSIFIGYNVVITVSYGDEIELC